MVYLRHCSAVCSVHPSPNGNIVLAELLIHPLQRALSESAAGIQPKRRDNAHLDRIPPPMIPNSPEKSPSFCAMLASLCLLTNSQSDRKLKISLELSSFLCVAPLCRRVSSPLLSVTKAFSTGQRSLSVQHLWNKNGAGLGCSQVWDAVRGRRQHSMHSSDLITTPYSGCSSCSGSRGGGSEGRLSSQLPHPLCHA